MIESDDAFVPPVVTKDFGFIFNMDMTKVILIKKDDEDSTEDRKTFSIAPLIPGEELLREKGFAKALFYEGLANGVPASANWKKAGSLVFHEFNQDTHVNVYFLRIVEPQFKVTNDGSGEIFDLKDDSIVRQHPYMSTYIAMCQAIVSERNGWRFSA